VVINDEMAQLRCNFCAIPSHEQHLANSPDQPSLSATGAAHSIHTRPAHTDPRAVAKGPGAHR
jgi:hypothetical protein